MFRKGRLQTILSFLLIQSYIHNANQNVLGVQRGDNNLLFDSKKVKLNSEETSDNIVPEDVVMVVLLDTHKLIGKPNYTFCIEKGYFKVVFFKGITASNKDEIITEIKTDKVELFGSYRNSGDWYSNKIEIKNNRSFCNIPFLYKEKTLKFDAELSLDVFLIKETIKTYEKFSLEIITCFHFNFVQVDAGGIPFISIGNHSKCSLFFRFSLSGNPIDCYMRPLNDSALQEVFETLCSNNAAFEEGDCTALQGNSVDGKNGSLILNPIFYIPLLLSLIILAALSFYFYSQKKRKYIIVNKKIE